MIAKQSTTMKLVISIGGMQSAYQPIGRLYQYDFGVSQQTWFVADTEAIMADNGKDFCINLANLPNILIINNK